MRTTYLWIVLSSLVGGALSWPGAACGQDTDSAALQYGDGVRAYFAGNSSHAEQSLSNALTLNSQDPRIYYFRALSLLRQGRTAEARGDMMVGATLEAQMPQRFAVGTALERVQGHDRLLLEQFRRQARLDAGATGASNVQAGLSVPSNTLRQRVVIPLNEYLQPGTPQPVAPRTFAPSGQQPLVTPSQQSPARPQEDPFRDDAQKPAAAPAVVPPAPAAPQQSTTAPADGVDPFDAGATPNTDATPTKPPANNNDQDPFGPQ